MRSSDPAGAERFRAVELETGRWMSSKLWTLEVSEGLATLRRFASRVYRATPSDSTVELLDQSATRGCRVAFRSRGEGSVRFTVLVNGPGPREALPIALARAGFTTS